MDATSASSAGPSSGLIATRVLALAGVALAAAAAWAILDRREVLAGGFVAASGLVLIGAGILARRTAAPLELVLDSLADRLFDGLVLAAIAWAARDSDPATSLGALVAMAAGFLGSYVRAKGASLGYGVTESPRTRALRYGLVAAGLLGGVLSWTIWAAAAVSIVASIVRSSQVAKEERA